MAKYTRELDALVKAISADIEETAMQALQERFGVSAGAPRRARATGRKKPEPRAKGQKRRPEILAELVGDLEHEIAREPGRGIEAIGAAMGVPTKNLALPIKKLIRTKAIKYTGEKRARKYFPAGANIAKRPRSAKGTTKRSGKRVLKIKIRRSGKRTARVVASPLKFVEREELARAVLKTGT